MSSERDLATRVFRLKAHHRPLFELLEKGHAFEVDGATDSVGQGGEWVQLLSHLLAADFLEPAEVDGEDVRLPPGAARQ